MESLPSPDLFAMNFSLLSRWLFSAPLLLALNGNGQFDMDPISLKCTEATQLCDLPISRLELLSEEYRIYLVRDTLSRVALLRDDGGLYFWDVHDISSLEYTMMNGVSIEFSPSGDMLLFIQTMDSNGRGGYWGGWYEEFQFLEVYNLTKGLALGQTEVGFMYWCEQAINAPGEHLNAEEYEEFWEEVEYEVYEEEYYYDWNYEDGVLTLNLDHASPGMETELEYAHSYSIP